MASLPADEPVKRTTPLARILREIRRRRGLRAADVARAMGMPLRSYEYFEAGGGRLDPDRVHAFAQAADADPYAILLALEIGSPEFALRCLDNKAATVLLMALQDFDATVGDELARLDAATLIAGFTRAFDELTATARERDAFVESWMTDKSLRAAPPDEDPGVG